MSLEGIQNEDTAQRSGIRPNTVTDIRKGFIAKHWFQFLAPWGASALFGIPGPLAAG